MAKFDPLIGITGKLGNVSLYVDKHGRQIVRTVRKAKDPKTPKQLAHRAKFALVNKSLSPLCATIKNANNDDSTVYRKLVGKAYKEAIVGEYPNFGFDYSKIEISNGDLTLPENITASTTKDSRTLNISWESNNSSDIVNIVCFYQLDTHNAVYSERTKSSAGKATLELPNNWDAALTHCWIYLSSWDFKNKSGSFYVKL